MDIVKVEEAVGHVLCHDITKIIPGEYKGRAFKKGHIITPDDIPELLKLGKEHLYVWKVEAGRIHENEAGLRLAQAVSGQGLRLTEPKEGKVNLVAEYDGLSLSFLRSMENGNPCVPSIPGVALSPLKIVCVPISDKSFSYIKGLEYVKFQVIN
ncbi:hypothetical protein Ga0466249_002180 [Sporomusaceae bacterium BoRhaA]|uniref:hypothetical protein n=1 Tax=Pelorhabdus rhamnosifermentans TaxID=2772457 RepID=UPI001C064079|nr:hypothetical protein [Pelorhabdus rhamnosifermentans]MBU2701069.1 hypothetical protein [Pelorhabdus rhamnosifermentans]